MMDVKRFDIHDDDYCGFYTRECEDGRVMFYDDHAAAIAEKDKEIARLKERLRTGDCIHCGETVSDDDVEHWRTCEKHPANAEIARLRKVVGTVAASLEYALDEYSGSTGEDAVGLTAFIKSALAELDGARP